MRSLGSGLQVQFNGKEKLCGHQVLFVFVTLSGILWALNKIRFILQFQWNQGDRFRCCHYRQTQLGYYWQKSQDLLICQVQSFQRIQRVSLGQNASVSCASQHFAVLWKSPNRGCRRRVSSPCGRACELWAWRECSVAFCTLCRWPGPGLLHEQVSGVFSELCQSSRPSYNQLPCKHASVPHRALAHDSSDRLCSRIVFHIGDRSACCWFPACGRSSDALSDSFLEGTFCGRCSRRRWNFLWCHVPLSCGCPADSLIRNTIGVIST